MLVATLAEASDGLFVTECETVLSAALDRIAKGGVDIILAKLDLPDSSGIATFDQLFALASHVPIMTLAERDGKTLARDAIQPCAQGYLSKGHYSSSLVPQALRTIIGREAVEEELYRERAHAEATLNCIGDAVISLGMEGNVTCLNPVAEMLTGWSREKAYGRAITDVMPLVDSETRQFLKRHPVVNVIDDATARGIAADIRCTVTGQHFISPDASLLKQTRNMIQRLKASIQCKVSLKYSDETSTTLRRATSRNLICIMDRIISPPMCILIICAATTLICRRQICTSAF